MFSKNKQGLDISPEEKQKFIKNFKIYVPKKTAKTPIYKEKSKTSKSKNFLILILISLIIAFGITGFLIYKKFYLKSNVENIAIQDNFEIQEQPESINIKDDITQESPNEDFNATSTQFLSEELIKIDKFADVESIDNIDLGKIVVSIKIPKQDKDKEVLKVKGFIKDDLKELPEIFKEWILGGVFEIEILPEFVESNAVATISYNEELIKNTDFIETDLVAGFYYLNPNITNLKDYFWEIPSDFQRDDEINTITVSLPHKSKFYIAVIPKSINNLITTKYNQMNPIKKVTISQDSDNDGLTDIEESIFKTNAGEKDTDKDGFLDGVEIQNLYNPLEPKKKLLDSDLIEEYQADEYKFLIPKNWLVKELKGQNGIIILPSDIEGEFFEILLLENKENLSLKQWYSNLSPYTKDSQIIKINLKNIDADAIQTIDGLNVYISQNNYVYALIYNIGAKQEIAFPSIFKMFVNSFEIKISPQENEILNYLEGLSEFKCEIKNEELNLVVYRKDKKAKVDLKDKEDHIIYIVDDKDKYVYDAQSDKWIKIKNALPDGVEQEGEPTSKKYLSSLPKGSCQEESINEKIFYIPPEKIIEVQ